LRDCRRAETKHADGRSNNHQESFHGSLNSHDLHSQPPRRLDAS
jgi:hypothetical protein